MLNLRFKYVVISSGIFVARNVPKANKMIANKDKYDVNERYAMACKIMDHLRRRSRTKTNVFGKENIPKDENFIVYSNHQGKYDAIGILLSLEQPCGVLWEKGQASKLVGKQVCGLVDGEPIDLTDIRAEVKSIGNVTNAVKNGRNFLIFPEGGYKDDTHNNLQEFKSGCFSCSIKSQSTILPVVIYDSYKSMNSNTFEKVTTEVHYLPPIKYEEYKGMKKNELCVLVKSRIEEKLNAIKEDKKRNAR